MTPTEVEIKRFWEYCELHYTIPYWVDDNGSLAFYGEVDSELLKSINLNNLFEYAVEPKLDGYMMFTGEGGIHFIASKNGLNYEAIAEKEEDAIWQACNKAFGLEE